MIIVQAKAIPKDETSKNRIIKAAENLIEKSKSENGNINYNLYSSVQEDTLLFVEQWENLDILKAVSYTHLRAHETLANLVCRLLLEKIFFNDTATTEIYTLHIVGSVRCV